MKYYKLTLLSGLIIFFISCFEQPKGKIELNTNRVYRINKGDTQTSFTILNKGKAPLHIEDYTTSCGCTILNLQKGAIIAAQDSLIVPIKLQIDTLNAKKKIVYITIKSDATPNFSSFSIIY